MNKKFLSMLLDLLISSFTNSGDGVEQDRSRSINSEDEKPDFSNHIRMANTALILTENAKRQLIYTDPGADLYLAKSYQR